MTKKENNIVNETFLTPKEKWIKPFPEEKKEIICVRASEPLGKEDLESIKKFSKTAGERTKKLIEYAKNKKYGKQ
jgi:hypothetical protein